MASDQEMDDDDYYENNENIPIASQNNELVRTWSSLEQSLALVYDEDPRVNLKFLSQCYHEVFSYLMHVNKEYVALRNSGVQEFYPGKTHKISRDLYLVLHGFIEEKSNMFANKFVDDMPIECLFVTYATEYQRYRRIHKKLQYIFKYLDRFYVPNERKNEGFKEIYEIYRLAMVKWHEKVFTKYQEKIIKEFSNFMRLDREGKQIDKALISSASKSFIELGIVPEDDPLQFYKPLEQAFLNSTEEYYHEKSRKFMRELNVIKSINFEDYMNEIKFAMDQEAERVRMFLHESSIPELLNICEQKFVRDHCEKFNGSFGEYLRNGDLKNIARLINLISRFPDQIGIFKVTFREHIEKEGETAIGKLENVITVDPKTYVETILEVFNKYKSLVANELNNDAIFEQALEEAVRLFINNNAVTQASEFADRNAELLAKYCDLILSKDSEIVLPESELKKNLEMILVIFKLLKDKDGFQKFYENITARRLIYKQSVSDEMEEHMILQLKEYFGEQDSNCLKKIIENIKASENINEEFTILCRRDSNRALIRNFSVMILSDKHWPYKNSSPYATSKQYLENIPFALVASVDKFSAFYQSKFSGVKQPKTRKIESCGRRLQWLHNLGKGELDAEFLGKRYIFLTGAFQMAVLMQFNEETSYTFEQLKKNTHIMTAPAAFLQQTLSKLFESKILLCSDNLNNLKSKSKISLNVKFQSKKVRINLDQPLDAEADINRKETMKNIDSDRELLTQCAIVRVMKREKRLHRNELILLVLEELKKRFKPEVEIVKRSLAVSITKDFIVLDKNDRDTYVYIE